MATAVRGLSEPAPKPFQRMRSSLEQILRTATRSKKTAQPVVDDYLTVSPGKGKKRVGSEDIRYKGKSKGLFNSSPKSQSAPTRVASSPPTSIDSNRRVSIDSRERPSFRDESPSSRPTRTPSQQRPAYANWKFNASTNSLFPQSDPERRNVIRTATSMLCKEVVEPPLHMSRSEAGLKDWEEVEVRVRALARLERVWGKSGIGGSSSNITLESPSGINVGGEERERRLFTEALRDGFVLCQLMNKLQSSSIVHPDSQDDGFVRTSNITKFLAVCSSYGLPMFLRDDLIEATGESLARVARTIVALIKYVDAPIPERSKFVDGRDAMGGHDIGVVIERLDKLFHLEKASYAKFLACRGASAQQLLDLLQDLLDYDVDAATINRRRLFQALIRLSANSKLYPRCLTLTGLQQERLMAGGSFGDVYKGLLGDQSVAIKMMRVFEESDIDALLKEFGREALIWRQLSHPNLLPFFGLYYFQQRLCLVSPWMENGHMRAFLKKKVYDTDYLLSLILDVALGLEHLHDTGVVHSDLKGDNIFVTPSGRACIADFGLSSIITSVSSIQFTHSSKPTQGGTTRYQAPELLRGGHNDTLSDIYAFAGVAYEILTGTPPFPDLRTDGAVVTAVLRGDRPLQPDSCSGTPSLDGLWKLLQDCWEEQPARRPTAAQIVQRLMSPDIQATKMQSAPDWDESFTSRFRRYLASRRPLPSFSKFERIIFGDASNVDKSQRPASRPFLLPASDIKSAPSQKVTEGRLNVEINYT